ncbi:MAG: hypothetical protein NTV31_05495 [Bacteroidia bacterium]|nr:hypothetical protein [Bacteroidia bacterium]
MKSRMKLLALLLMLAAPTITLGQGGLLGSWKYVSSSGEMTMQINASTVVINGQSFPYKPQGNVLMIDEGTRTTPYPYMLDGNQLTLEFPGGMEIVFTRSATGVQPQGQLPQSMSRPSTGVGQEKQASTLSGKWLFQNQQGQLVLEFLSANQLSFNGETTQYQLKEGVIQAMGDYGWIDYPYTLSQGTLSITFPDGTRLPFTRTSSTVSNQQGINQQTAGGGSTWQLKGALCSWSGSSNEYSSYSRTQKIVFDGQGNFQFGSEGSFSSNAGIAYSGNPNVETGTYSVGESAVTLHYRSGETYQFKINMRQNNGMITELMYNGTLYATVLCK